MKDQHGTFEFSLGGGVTVKHSFPLEFMRRVVNGDAAANAELQQVLRNIHRTLQTNQGMNPEALPDRPA